MQKNLPSLAPAHKVDENKITSIIKPKKAPELKVTFTGAELKDFFPGEMPSVAIRSARSEISILSSRFP